MIDRKLLNREEATMPGMFKNEYFKDGEILFGVFYPTRYVIAVFDNGA